MWLCRGRVLDKSKDIIIPKGIGRTNSSLNNKELKSHDAALTVSIFVLIASATASTMGNIMAVVAVFEIHMDRNIVVNMKPSISLAELVPTYTIYT